MASPRVRTLIGSLLAGVVLMHVAWSSAMALVLQSRVSHRMIDVRRWPGEVSPRQYSEMASLFLVGALPSSEVPSTVFFGSSMTYGVPWREEEIMSARYAALRPGEHVVNAAVIGADVEYLENAILCGATNAQVHAGTVVLEIQVLNSVSTLARQAADGEPPGPPCDETVGRVHAWPFVLKHPLGAGWLPFLYDNRAFAQPESNITDAQLSGGRYTGLEQFRGIEAGFRRDVVTVLNRAKRIGRQVYAFPSPLYLPETADARNDAASVHAQIAAALDACRSVTEVVCLDPESFYTRRELYFELTHFNQRGHQVFAEWLDQKIARTEE